MTLPTLCQELIDEWKSVVAYLTLHVPQQQGQGVRSRVSSPGCSSLIRDIPVALYTVWVNGRLRLEVTTFTPLFWVHSFD